MEKHALLKGKALLVFDGNCILCSNTILLLSFLDRKRKLLFTSFDSEIWSRLKPDITDKHESIVLVHEGNFYYRSHAVLNTLSVLGFPWSVFKVFSIFPKQFLDSVYQLIANNRYRIFGTKKKCRIYQSIRERYIR